MNPEQLRNIRKEIARSMLRKDERLLYYVEHPNAKVLNTDSKKILEYTVFIIRELCQLEPSIKGMLQHEASIQNYLTVTTHVTGLSGEKTLEKLSKEDREIRMMCITYWANGLLDADTTLAVLKYYNVKKQH